MKLTPRVSANPYFEEQQRLARRQEQAIQDQLQRDKRPSIASWTLGIVVGLGVSGYVLYWLWQRCLGLRGSNEFSSQR